MPASTQQDRRAAIRSILGREPIANQEALIAALHAAGFAATQSSVSRDLRDLQAVKTAHGYALPDAVPAAAGGLDDVGDLLRAMTPAGPHLLVIKTAIGAAQQVALALDQSGWQDIVGTIAGDDTVFAATAGAVGQRRVIERMPVGAP